MNTRSIRFHLVAWHAAVVTGAFVLLGALMFTGLKVYLERSLGSVQTKRARQIADTLLANIGRTGDAHVTSEIDGWFAPDTNDRFIRISRKDGSVFYVSKSPRDMSFDTARIPPLTEPPGRESIRKETASANNQLLISSIAARSDDGRDFIIEVGASLEPAGALLHRLILLLGAGLAVTVLVATGGGYLLINRALAPVDRIAQSAERITLHNLRERLPITETGDELQRLSVSLNHMIARLEDAFQHNRRFTADASHELRTPLTILRGELESIVEDPHCPGEIQDKAASVLEEVQRLARIVEGLFSVSRLDAGEAQKERLPFDLAELAASTADQMCLLAEDKDISLTCEAPRAVTVAGDRARMKQVVVNLLDNAIKYTPAGGKVRLSVLTRNDHAVLEVEDTGIGIPATARSHIFERFFRVDQARSREMGGAGLGLSIVKSICTAHSGQVDFRSTEGAGSCFKVELPLAHHHNGNGDHKHAN